MFPSLSISLLFGVSSVAATVFTSISQTGLLSSYDFIVVGGGTAGSVIATRLTENPKTTVLLVEAGPTNVGLVDVEVPLFCATLTPDTAISWNYTTTAQSGINGRSIPLPRGHVLGGSSSVNFMVYNRGSEDDFNRLASVTGDQGWSWNSLLSYMKKIEKYVPSADNHNTAGQFNPSVHGTSGPLQLSLPGFAWPGDEKILATTQELPSQFPFNLDMNSGNTIGIGYTQSSINTFQRSSAATAYLQGEASSRSNLHILVGTTVTQLISNGSLKGKVSFNAVKMAQVAGGPSSTVKANKEIILSAGAIASPQLLLLSGIGAQSQLSKFGIKTLINNADVGQHLADHPLFFNQWSVTNNATFDNANYDANLAAQEFNEWSTSHTGPLVDSPTNQLGFFKLPKNSSIFKTYPDPSAGPTASNYELIFSNGYLSFTPPFPTSGNFLTITPVITSPASRGSVTLNSANPFDLPIVDPAYFTHPLDIFTAVQAFKAAMTFVTASAWKDFISAPFGLIASLTSATDDAIEAFIRSTAGSIFHPVGTAYASAAGASGGVVDNNLLVKGAAGLRVVDASIFPYIPATHIQGPVYIVAERAADLIKQAWNC